MKARLAALVCVGILSACSAPENPPEKTAASAAPAPAAAAAGRELGYRVPGRHGDARAGRFLPLRQRQVARLDRDSGRQACLRRLQQARRRFAGEPAHDHRGRGQGRSVHGRCRPAQGRRFLRKLPRRADDRRGRHQAARRDVRAHRRGEERHRHRRADGRARTFADAARHVRAGADAAVQHHRAPGQQGRDEVHRRPAAERSRVCPIATTTSRTTTRSSKASAPSTSRSSKRSFRCPATSRPPQPRRTCSRSKPRWRTHNGRRSICAIRSRATTRPRSPSSQRSRPASTGTPTSPRPASRARSTSSTSASRATSPRLRNS